MQSFAKVAFLKSVILGDAASGKSALLTKYTNPSSAKSCLRTIGIDYKSRKIITRDGSRVKLEIWDSAWQKRFKHITASYCRGAHAAIVVFNPTLMSSLQFVENFLETIHHSSKDHQNRHGI